MTVFDATPVAAVSVKAATATFAFTASAGDANPNKPCADLNWRLSAGAFAALTISNVSASTGARGGTSETGNTSTVDYRLAST